MGCQAIAPHGGEIRFYCYCYFKESHFFIFILVVVVVVVFTIRPYPCVSCGAIPVQHDKVSFQTM